MTMPSGDWIMSRTGNPSPVEALNMASPSRPECCVLEIFGGSVGLLITEEYGFVFHAASAKAWSLDRRVFARRQDAERAIRALLSPDRRKSRVPGPR